jgi:ketosteroid isomerase-like protein
MTTAELEDWLQAYKRAWVSRNPGAAAKLFSDDAAYFETPFAPPARGKAGIMEYWSAATRNQSDITFSWEIISLAESVGIVRWQGAFKRTLKKTRVELDGVLVLEFDEAGLCNTLREWWHRRER